MVFNPKYELNKIYKNRGDAVSTPTILLKLYLFDSDMMLGTDSRSGRLKIIYKNKFRYIQEFANVIDFCLHCFCLINNYK
jgi:hypothetical protein